jgi:hypothetical protein
MRKLQTMKGKLGLAREAVRELSCQAMQAVRGGDAVPVLDAALADAYDGKPVSRYH